MPLLASDSNSTECLGPGGFSAYLNAEVVRPAPLPSVLASIGNGAGYQSPFHSQTPATSTLAAQAALAKLVCSHLRLPTRESVHDVCHENTSLFRAGLKHLPISHRLGWSSWAVGFICLWQWPSLNSWPGSKRLKEMSVFLSFRAWGQQTRRTFTNKSKCQWPVCICMHASEWKFTVAAYY